MNINRGLFESPVVDFKNEPTGSETEKTRYIVGSGTLAGAFVGKTANHIATLINGNWVFMAPYEGQNLYFITEDKNRVFDGTTWKLDGTIGSDKIEIATISGTTATLPADVGTPSGDAQVEIGYLDSTGAFQSLEIEEVVKATNISGVNLTLSTNYTTTYPNAVAKVKYLANS